MTKLKVPIGIDNFREVIEGDFSYVDKTLLVEEVLAQPGKVQLITRPRRFGKTLAMSMLAHFFDHRLEAAHLFHGLAIEGRPCFQEQGRYPVIFLSFKDLKAPDHSAFLELFAIMVKDLFREHLYLLNDLDEFEAEDFRALAAGKAGVYALSSSIAWLMRLLQRHHKQQVVLLIDEYDSPIHEAHAAGFYSEIITFMRGTLGRLLKSNDALKKAVLTGILRVARESIFSDLNNIDVHTPLSKPYADKFGFTEEETRALLLSSDKADKLEEVRAWYNGYQIGGTIIYNPWSLIQFLNSPEPFCMPFWVNTSSNLLVRDQLLHSDATTQDALKSLLAGNTIETQIQEQTVFRDLKHNASTLWSFLLFTGYLTVAQRRRVGNNLIYSLKVPNIEVMLLFQDIIKYWLERQIGEPKTQLLLQALIEGDDATFGEYLAELVMAILSYYDTGGQQQERIYHCFVLGLLAHLSDRFTIRSNRESGMGRYDVMMLPKQAGDRGIVMEFKMAESVDKMDDALSAALAQIESKGYLKELDAAGVGKRSEIAVTCHRKQIRIRARHSG